MIANAGARIGRTLLHVGLVEWLVLLYLLVLAGMLVFTPAERHPAPHLVLVLAVLFVLVAAIVVYRKYFEGRPVFRFFFHAIVIAGVMVPFFQLRDMIPLIHPGDVDEQLRALDLRLFGGDAAIWFEQFATPFTSAWFAACYFGYYVVGGSFVVGMMLFCRRQMVFMEFGLVVLGTVCVGTTLYCVFPALGPYVYLADRFLGPLPGETLVPFVHGTIQHGPLRDVFPSMHAGVPVAIFLFSARHFRPVAVFCGLWVPHIVVSTMFLRYHYLIDVIVGVALAVLWFLLARPMLRAYQGLRRRNGVLAGP
jgi:membrane-associated phospholipid phosphatase